MIQYRYKISNFIKETYKVEHSGSEYISDSYGNGISGYELYVTDCTNRLFHLPSIGYINMFTHAYRRIGVQS